MMKKYGLTALATVVAISAMFLYPLTASAQSDTPLADPIPGAIPQVGGRIRLELVADGLIAPNWGISAPGEDQRLFVTDQPGILWAIDLRSGDKEVFLDVSDRLVPLGIRGPGTFDERGLLGVAFHPAYPENGLLYTYTSQPVDGAVDFSTMPAGEIANHHTVITEWQVPEPRKRESVVDPGSARELLRIDQPQFNHNAGALNFGSDDMLYIALGDGGGADDQGVGHGTDGNGQDPSNVLGTILRIDPTASNSANGAYGIPRDNPFVDDTDATVGGEEGCLDGFCDEIFAYGFRNPFRFSFDAARGDLYVGDVGQNDIEEVDVVMPGGNYGWNLKEGSFCFNPNGDERGFVFECDSATLPEGLVDPVAEYDHDEGVAIIGGFVYRGTSVPWLRGRYVFGDLAGAGAGGRLFFLMTKNVVRFDRIRESRAAEFRILGRDALGMSLLGFGEDAQRELYVLANNTGVPFPDPTTGLPTGVVLKIQR